MAVNYKVEWPMNLGAPRDSLEAKQPDIDNGLDVPDPARYYSREFMRLEWERLWPRVWLLAGVTSDIPEEGDYVTFDIGHEQFVIVRQADGSIRAFYNVCSHRGNRVCLNERGSVARFTCSFHGWQFGLDGRLLSITDEHTFDKRLIAHRPGMTEVRCDSLGGIIFINMDGKAPPLREYLGLPPGYIERYRIDQMHVVHHVRSAWRANWKTGVDAFYETYHLPHVHPQTQSVMEDFSQYDLFPNGASRMIVPICVKSHRVADQDTIDQSLQFMLKEAGIDPTTFTGTARDVRTAIQKAKRERAKRFGLTHYDEFTDGQLTDSWATGLFPNVQMGMHPEGVFIMRFLPHGDDPEIFYYDTMILYRHVDDPNYTVPAWMGLPAGTDVTGATRPAIIHVPLGQKPNLGDVLDQDSELLPIQQQGIRSRGFKGPLWGQQEQRVRHFHRELDRYINGEK
ncbi:MAG: aromatic ring-hydroxylating dioxygenase subunit alpha [Steroidobacteraceae bacterium]|nr:aromatic ring-hydroxylating dioxygenase subunit alpha [Steroidobacteraceae bacterium]MDW8259229.1 aromatic ring-hydroxylating dioxygenase subunit alpha [Gammaproteobacteria bacterium]